MMAAALIALTCIFAVPVGTQSFEYPREALFCFAALPLISIASLGTGVNISNNLTLAVFVLLVWWVVCSIRSKDAQTAFNCAVRFILAVVVSLIAVCSTSIENVLSLLTIACAVNCIVGILQRFGVPIPYKEAILNSYGSLNKGRYYARALLGNTNYFGVYIVPHVFFSLYLGWYPVTVLLIGGLIAAECAGAIIATVAGVAFYFSPLASVICFPLALFMFRKRFTLVRRFKYFQIAWRQIKVSPICGVGFDVFKVNIPYLQYGNPVKVATPQRCHNDVLQCICDVGVVGLAIIGYIIFNAYVAAGGWLLSALVGVLVAGIGLHTFHIFPVNLVFWVVIFSCLKTAEPVFIVNNPYIPFIMFLFIPLVMPYLKSLVGDIYYRQCQHDKSNIYKAIYYMPHDEEVKMNKVFHDVTVKNDYIAGFEGLCDLKVNRKGLILPSVLYSNMASLQELIQSKGRNIFEELSKSYEGC